MRHHTIRRWAQFILTRYQCGLWFYSDYWFKTRFFICYISKTVEFSYSLPPFSCRPSCYRVKISQNINKTMAPSIKLVIFQFFCFFVVHECKLNELYRWKQISFEKLEAGENIPKTIPIPMLTDPSVNFDYWMFTKIPVCYLVFVSLFLNYCYKLFRATLLGMW